MTTTIPAKKYELVYRTGGTKNCQWKRVLGVYEPEQAIAKQVELQRAGYFSLMAEAGWWDKIGLPIGWDFNTWLAEQQESPDWRDDEAA
jgi:hypothetical protein